MTTALEGGEGSASRAGRCLPSRKARYPLYRMLRGSQGRSGQMRKISPRTGIRSLDRPARSQSLYRLRVGLFVAGKCEGKFVPVYDIRMYRGRRGVAPLILNVGTKMEVSGQLHALLINLAEETRYWWISRLGGPGGQCGGI